MSFDLESEEPDWEIDCLDLGAGGWDEVFEESG